MNEEMRNENSEREREREGGEYGVSEKEGNRSR